MCYHCATNPSIAAMSLLLSHHGVTFTSVVVSSLPSWCCLCRRIVAVPLLSYHHGFVVAIMVSPSCRSWFHHCRRGVTFTFVMVLLLPLRCCLHVGHGFIIAIAVLPSCWSRFRHCHHGVAFVVASLWCHHCSCVVISKNQHFLFH